MKKPASGNKTNKRNQSKHLILLILIALGVVVFGGKEIISVIRQKLELRRLQKQLAQLEMSNEYLKQELQELKNNPLRKEQEVRRRLGVVRPNEIKYKFIKED